MLTCRALAWVVKKSHNFIEINAITIKKQTFLNKMNKYIKILYYILYITTFIQ